MSYFSFKPEFDPDAAALRGGAAVGRGGAAVGMLFELPALEFGAIVLLRQWCDGEAGRAAIAHDFCVTLGSAHGAEAVNLLAGLVTLMVQRGRRPLMRHAADCSCFGGDESAFAQLVATATTGERDDAMAFAMIFLPPAEAFEAVLTAERLGPVILSLARAWTPARIPPTHH